MNSTTERFCLQQIAQNNMTAYHAFVTAHSRMVYQLAHQLVPKGFRAASKVVFDDLVGDGQLALCESVGAYLQKHHNLAVAAPPYKFSTFAYTRIRRALIARLRTDETVEKTEWRARQLQASMQRYDAMVEALGRTPTYDEVADTYGTTLADIAAIGQHQYVEPSDNLTPENAAAEDLSYIEYKRLPLSVRTLLKQMTTSNASMGAMAQAWDLDRDTVALTLSGAYDKVS